MRSLQIRVPTAAVERVIALAVEHEAHSPLAIRASEMRPARPTAHEDWSVVLLDVSNHRVGALVDAVRRDVESAHFLLIPAGVLPLVPPLRELDERVADVSRLSTIELVLASLQSIGSWRGLLVFSFLAAVIGTYGLLFNVSYLLVAAMLVNPMGAPALVSVVALAVGDTRMFARGGYRFFLSLAIQAAVAMLIGMLYGLDEATVTMEQVTSLSMLSVVVALAAGAAGAQAQVKSDRDSLVSGTAAGFMVAAALAPPAGVLGLSVSIGRWQDAGVMAFLLGLQFLAIAIGGWAALRLFGVRPREASMGRGSIRARNAILAAAAVLTVALILVQSRMAPLRRADRARAAAEAARSAVADVPELRLIESTARFTRAPRADGAREVLLLEMIVENAASPADNDALARRLRGVIRQRLQTRLPEVRPFIDVTVLPGGG